MMRHLVVADQPEDQPAEPQAAPRVQVEPPVVHEDQVAADMDHEDEATDWSRLAWQGVQSLD